MAITSFPFDNQDTTEDQYSKLFRQFVDTGVIGAYGSGELAVTANGSGMKVSMAPGMAILRGHMFWSDAIESLIIDAASAVQRTDAIVLHLDPSADSIVPLVLKGNTTTGAAPSLLKTDLGIYEIALAWVTVPASVASIVAGNVQDARSFGGSNVGSWSTATRPSNPLKSQLGYNNTTKAWEFYDGAAWQSLVSSLNWTAIGDKPSTFTPSPHHHAWTDIDNAPAAFPPSAHEHAWTEISGKPASFPPAAHTHSGYADAAGDWGYGYISNGAGVPISLRRSNGWMVIRTLSADFPVVTTDQGDTRYANINHTHAAPSTVNRANGSDRPHGAEPAGSGSYYAVWVDANHNFCRNTSSRRYKENIRDHNVDPAAVLALQPKIYDRKPTEDGGGRNTDEYGLIAEEVFETLPEIVTFHNGIIDSIRYDLLAVSLLNVVKDQERRIAELEARL